MVEISVVLLAAGDSQRMGYPKALLPLGDGTFLTHILDTLGDLDFAEIRVILGRDEPLVRPWLGKYPVTVLVNPNPENGQFSSMRLGFEGLGPHCRGCMIWPVDQPLVPGSVVRGLAALYLDSGTELAMPECDGRAGHPAIFGRGLIRELLALPAGANPKALIAGHKARAAWLPTREKGTIEDIDTPEDYLRLTGVSLASALARIPG